MGQELYWVIGPRTDAGKTTIATALLRLPNRRRQPAVGFKPYSATLLGPMVDRMIAPDAAIKGRILGEDARELAESSPLTDVDDAECIVPVQYVCHPSYHSAVVARFGSKAIGNRRLLASDHRAELFDRPDIVALFERNGTPLREMAAANHLKLVTCRSLAENIVDSSYRVLASKDGVSAVVCEGAGHFLPLWPGMPTVDHIVQLGEGLVRLLPHIRLTLETKPREALSSLRTIDHLLQEVRGLSTSFPLVSSGQRQQLADEVVDRLFSRSRS